MNKTRRHCHSLLAGQYESTETRGVIFNQPLYLLPYFILANSEAIVTLRGYAGSSKPPMVTIGGSDKPASSQSVARASLFAKTK